MATQLPTLVGTNCIYVQACCLLQGTPGKAVSTEPIVVKQRREGSTQYLRLLQTGEPVSHVHVDIAQKTYFGKTPPTATHRMADFRNALAQYTGCAIDLFFQATYITLASSLPPSGLILAGQNKVLTKFEGVEVELSGAELKLSNAPVDSIEWQTLGDGVFVKITFNRPASISDSYLFESLETTNEALNTFVLGKATPSRPWAGG